MMAIVIPMCTNVLCTDRLWPFTLLSSCIVSSLSYNEAFFSDCSESCELYLQYHHFSFFDFCRVGYPFLHWHQWLSSWSCHQGHALPSFSPQDWAWFSEYFFVQEIPCNHFFAFKPSSTALAAELHPIPDFMKNWQELLLVPLIHKSIHKICTVLQIPDADAKVDLITGILGQGATFWDQDIVLSYDNFPITHHYLKMVQFKKLLANLNLSSDAAASVTVFLNLKIDSYSIDGMLMNPHVSPYTACTNSALQATVDLLIQQAVFQQYPAVILANPSSSLAFTFLLMHCYHCKLPLLQSLLLLHWLWIFLLLI